METTKTTEINFKVATTQFLTREEIIANSVFVLEQGWDKAISECARAGASIVLPNLNMGSLLLAQTIIRQGKPYIVTTESLWEKLENALHHYPEILSKLSIIFFESGTINGICPSVN
ncbi:hypothetical protein [Chondrinema litorale]|uniref:hypothetical protein n=1 Tax=Chondrinema litorale TaxID=2994555 RepID=UPI0025435163|nr:hypothetical protein [Chondrinema litorale]UZR97808.1 hypothetical protein OQ292_27760 [Chondrinema litorale]